MRAFILMMRAIHTTSLALVILVGMPLVSYGQDTPTSDTKFVSNGTGTEELDNCRIDGEASTKHAGEHFTRGLNLYSQGDYRAAIDEFVLSYCHRPNVASLKNISESFRYLVDYEKAVAYLERYILENPSQQRNQRRILANHVEVLRKLPARLSIATEPPEASVTLTGETGIRARGISNAEEPIEVLKGKYVMTLEKVGYESRTETIEVKIGQPYSFFYQLKPKRGTLRVVTVPSTANIFIGDRRVAIGTYVEQLPVGRYTINVEADGHEPYKEDVEITGGDPKNITLELERKPRSGRLEMITAATLGGAWAGSSVAALLSDKGEVVGGVVPLGIAIGFGGAYLAVPQDIPVGWSSYIIGATIIGASEGAFLAAHFVCPTEPNGSRGDCDDEALIAASLAGAVSGFLASSVTADWLDPDPGDASLINSGAIWGTTSGLLFWTVFDRDQRIATPLTLAGLNLGILSGALLARRANVSRRHVTLIDVSGVLGLLAGGATGYALDESDSVTERIPHFALLGLTLGLITGTYLTRHIDEPPALGAVSPSMGTIRDADGDTMMTLGIRGAF